MANEIKQRLAVVPRELARELEPSAPVVVPVPDLEVDGPDLESVRRAVAVLDYAVANDRVHKLTRARRRDETVAERMRKDQETFTECVVPRLLKIGGQRGWRVEALQLCRRHGIACSERTLYRRVQAAREAGYPIPQGRQGPPKRGN